MVEVTVEEMWRLALPGGTTLMAGASGLSRAVTWPVMLRTRPPAFESIKGSEVALVSTATLRMLDERLTLARVIRSLGDMGVAAVAVVGEINEEAKGAAEGIGLSLFALPAEARLQEVEQIITRTVADRRMELHQRGQEIQRQLTDLIIEGRGLAAIVERVAQITGKPAAMGDERSGIRYYSIPSNVTTAPTRDEISSALGFSVGRLAKYFPGASLSASDPPKAKLSLTMDGLAAIISPITVRGNIGGYFWVLGAETELDELDGLAVSRAAAACALELVKEIAVLEAEDRFHGDLLEDLVSDNPPSLDGLRSRSERLGWDLNQACIALVFEASGAGALQSSDGGGRTAGAKLGEVIERRLSRRQIAALVGVKSGRAIVLYPHEDASDVSALKREVDELRRELASQLGDPNLSVGLGRYHLGQSGQRESFLEAEQAVAMGTRLFGRGRVTYFGDLGIYRLLFRMHGTQELQTFYEGALGKLLEYDRKNHAELVKTLEAYFTCRNSPTEAAEMLHLHRNTLLYRLQRIEEIAGIRLDDPETRLALHLALRIRETLQAVGD